MRYLELLDFCEERREDYPFNVLSPKLLGYAEFAPVTIFYGANGSGKSTALRVVARTMGAPALSEEAVIPSFGRYVRSCKCVLSGARPRSTLFVRSEDVMGAINRARKEYGRFERDVKATGLDPSQIYGDAMLSRTEDCQWIFSRACEMTEQWSNGEVAMMYYDNIIVPDSLYFLDEPETSLSPVFQQRLAEKVGHYARFLGCQFVIATHSPFLLGIPGARVIDLDRSPATERRWTELEHVRFYYEFFKRHKDCFEGR